MNPIFDSSNGVLLNIDGSNEITISCVSCGFNAVGRFIIFYMTTLQQIKADASAEHWHNEELEKPSLRIVDIIVEGIEDVLTGFYCPKVFDWSEVWIVRKKGKRIFDAKVLFWKYL